MSALAGGLGLIALLGCQVLAATWSVPGVDWEPRPRVLFGPGDEPALRQRLAREPYASLFERVVQRADQQHDLSDHSTSAEQLKANTAQAAAFVYALDRATERVDDQVVVVQPTAQDRLAYGQRAEALLTGMIDHCRMEDYTTGTDDIHCAQELSLYATAFDLLAGAGYPFADQVAVEDRLATYAADFFYKWTVTFWPILTRAANQNHGSKSAAAIGLAAIALNGYDRSLGDELDGYRDPRAWIDFGLSVGVSLGLEALTSAEGGYGEGPIYYRYGAINTAPFYWAWHRYTQGADWQVDGVPFSDPWTHPDMVRISDWLLAILMPDMTFPPFDDGTPGVTHFWGAFVGLPSGAAYRWAWERGVSPLDTSGSVDQAPLTLVTFDDAVVAHEPDFGPSVFLPEGGQAVFRTDWGPEATYLIMQAEHGLAAGWAFRHDGEWLDGAGGHEHPDPATTHLMAHGERLVIDCGYLGWENHAKVREAVDHNLLFVDGAGPQGPQLVVPPFTIEDGQVIIEDPSVEGGWVPGADADGQLVQAFVGDDLEHALVQVRYSALAPPTDWQRRMVFVDGRYFVQADVARPDDGQDHAFELLTHLNGGGSSGGTFDLAADGARVVRPGASLELRVAAAAGPPALSETEAEHDAWRWREETHSVLHAATEGPSAALLTLLVPVAAGDPAPQLERLASADGLAGFRITSADRQELVGLAAPGQGQRQLTDLSFTGSFALAARPARGTTDRILLGDGTHLACDDRSIWLAQPGTVALAWSDQAISGHYSGPANQLTIGGAGAAAGGAGYCGLRAEGPDAIVDLPGDGPFEIELGGAAGNRPPVALIGVAAQGRVGEPLSLDGSASCDPDGDALDFVWRVVQGPVRSRVGVSDPAGLGTELIPDWPGAYRVGLTVSDGQADSSEAMAWVWVERAQPADPDGGPSSDGGGDGDPDMMPGGGGCGCTHRPAQRAGLFPLALLLAGLVGRRRTTRR